MAVAFATLEGQMSSSERVSVDMMILMIITKRNSVYLLPFHILTTEWMTKDMGIITGRLLGGTLNAFLLRLFWTAAEAAGKR